MPPSWVSPRSMRATSLSASASSRSAVAISPADAKAFAMFRCQRLANAR